MTHTQNTVYWIIQPEQIDCLASPARMAIIDYISADGPVPIEQIARCVNMKTTAVYHHIHKLEAVGLVQAVDRQWQDGARKPQILYATPARRMRLAKALEDTTLNAPVAKAAASVLRQAERDFVEGQTLAPTTDGPARNLSFARHYAPLSKEQLAAVNQHLDAIAEIMWNARNGAGTPVAISWAQAPRLLPEKD